MDPLEYGWELDTEENFSPVLQDKQDDFYLLPTEILKGCSCKKSCNQSRRCGCRKSQFRQKCSPLTCKNCSCYNGSLLFDYLHIREEDFGMNDDDAEEWLEEEVDEVEEEEGLETDKESDWETDCDDDILPVKYSARSDNGV